MRVRTALSRFFLFLFFSSKRPVASAKNITSSLLSISRCRNWRPALLKPRTSWMGRRIEELAYTCWMRRRFDRNNKRRTRWPWSLALWRLCLFLAHQWQSAASDYWWSDQSALWEIIHWKLLVKSKITGAFEDNMYPMSILCSLSTYCLWYTLKWT